MTFAILFSASGSPASLISESVRTSRAFGGWSWSGISVQKVDTEVGWGGGFAGVNGCGADTGGPVIVVLWSLSEVGVAHLQVGVECNDRFQGELGWVLVLIVLPFKAAGWVEG